jgi:hypothetical protein
MFVSEGSFLQHAMHHYDNPQCCSVEEFDEDLKRFLYIKKLFTRYKLNNELRERLILNHLIVLFNVFGDEATKLLFYKIDKEDWGLLATFLVFLNRMPEKIDGVDSSDLKLDENVIRILRDI